MDKEDIIIRKLNIIMDKLGIERKTVIADVIADIRNDHKRAVDCISIADSLNPVQKRLLLDIYKADSKGISLDSLSKKHGLNKEELTNEIDSIHIDNVVFEFDKDMVKLTDDTIEYQAKTDVFGNSEADNKA